MAKNASIWANNALETGNFGGVDQRTVLDTAYNSGIRLGTIKESLSQEAWAKTIGDGRRYAGGLPDRDETLADQPRSLNPNIGLGFLKTYAGGGQNEQLSNSIETHRRYTLDPSKGNATIDKDGYIIGMIGGSLGNGKFQPGLLQNSAGTVTRYTPPGGVGLKPGLGFMVRIDEQGKKYYMDGVFYNRQKVMIEDGTGIDYVDPRETKDQIKTQKIDNAAKDDAAIKAERIETERLEAEKTENRIETERLEASQTAAKEVAASKTTTTARTDGQSAGDKARRAAEQGSASVIQQAVDRGASASEVATIESASTAAEDQMSDLATGINTTGRTGFNKGGLVPKPKKK